MKKILIILALMLALVGCEWGSEEDQRAETVAVVPVPGSEPVVLDPDGEQTSAERPPGVDGHEDSRDETPPGVSLEEAARVLLPVGGIGPPQPLGGAQNLSCRQHFVRNHSSRQGATVSMFVDHYTVSNPGTLDAIWNLFNTASFQASSTFLLEPLTGRCEHIVPFSEKPWTQGAFNPVSESVEIICCRSDPSRAWWLSTKIIKEGLLAEMTVDRLRARGLPPRLVDPVGCTPQAGWTDHNRLECGNNHTDVGRNFPFDVVDRQVKALFNGGSLSKLVWQVRSGGKVLFQQQAVAISGIGGYDRLLSVMKGRGEAKVRAAEKANGDVRIVLVTIQA